MKAEDLVDAIKSKIPSLVEDFTGSVVISNIINQGYSAPDTTFLVTTAAAHGLKVGKAAYISDVTVPLTISAFTRNGVLGTITTASPHDLTTGSQTTVTTRDAVEATFNGTFSINSIPDRNTIKVVMADSGDTVGTGSMLADDAGSPLSAVSGIRAIVSVPTTTTFTYTVPYEVTATPVLGTAPAVKTQPRISSAVTLDRFIESHYSNQTVGAAWLIVVLGDSLANKSRRENTDATDNIQPVQYFNQKFTQAADVYVILPATDSLSGRSVRDRCEELLQPICQCILFKKFDSLVTAGLFNPLQFTGHGIERYTTAYYVYRYSFELTVQMQRADTIGYEEDVAFRDIDLTQNFNTGTEEMTSAINLDEVI